jgi:hypothetical protein
MRGMRRYGKEWRVAWRFDDEIPENHALFVEFFSADPWGEPTRRQKKKLFGRHP